MYNVNKSERNLDNNLNEYLQKYNYQEDQKDNINKTADNQDQQENQF